MKNQEILTCFEGLQKLRQAADRRLPARASFAIVRNIKTLQPIVDDFRESYQSLLDRYAEPIENDQYQVKAENIQEFNNELDNLYNLDINLEIVKIKFSDIEDFDFSLEETEALYFMMENGET